MTDTQQSSRSPHLYKWTYVYVCFYFIAFYTHSYTDSCVDNTASELCGCSRSAVYSQCEDMNNTYSISVGASRIPAVCELVIGRGSSLFAIMTVQSVWVVRSGRVLH